MIERISFHPLSTIHLQPPVVPFGFCPAAGFGIVCRMDASEAALIAAAVKGDAASFEPIIRKYSPRLFATARRYARRESEVEDIVQEVWLKAFQKLASFRGDAPFEHWLMRLTVRTCYDFLREHQRNREDLLADLPEKAEEWLGALAQPAEAADTQAAAARQLVNHVLDQLPPAARLVIVLLEIEDRSVKEISQLTGWPVPLVKVRAFRARAAMRKILARIARDKYL